MKVPFHNSIVCNFTVDQDRTVARKSSIGGLYVRARGLDNLKID